ncbi:MAG: hypothetical protein H7175_04615 [Burkholderiales bacterium]|nr:hypothetical protein [Anaerolineae bacterium]
MRLKRANYPWLGVIGALMAVVALSGQASAPVLAAMVALFAVALAASVESSPRKTVLMDKLQSPLISRRMSPAAREAVERARRRGGFIDPDVTITDIGLICQQSGQAGIVMRRSRTVSKDDDSVRPYVTLNVKPTEADRRALIRFEMIDQNGAPQYIHEMRTYLRDGEVNVLADHHLPLMGNDKLKEMGDWDLHITIDGTLAGALTFTVTPSLEERDRELLGGSRDLNQSRYRLEDDGDSYDDGADEDIPLSLEELLRRQSRR